MRSLLIGTPLTGVLLACVLGTTAAGAESLEESVARTRRELEILKIQHRLFWTVEYPRELRELDAAIRLTRAEIDALEERVRHYRRYERDERSRPFGPFWDDRQEAELALLDAELRLNNLSAERLALRRTSGDRARLLELRIAAVRAELADLERERLPAAEPVPADAP